MGEDGTDRYLPVGSGSSTSPQAAPGVFGAGDVDGDGDWDLAISSDRDARLFILEQQEDENFLVHVLDENKGQAGGMVIQDVDGDGFPMSWRPATMKIRSSSILVRRRITLA